MTDYRYCKLIMITDDNHNKYYEMQETSENIQVKYGRVDSSCITITKPISQWNSLIKSKLKKGYKDVTDLVAIVKNDSKPRTLLYSQELYDIFLKKMMDYRDGLVSSTYSVKANQVTRKQLKQAQFYINELAKIKPDYELTEEDIKSINNLLIQLYTVIPRYMNKVQNYLIPNISLNNLVQKEQDNLDAISSQVIEEIQENTDEKITYSPAEQLGIKISKVDSSPTEIEYITKQISKKIKGLFEVEIPKHKNKYRSYLESNAQKQQDNSKYLIHGTRCSSVIPIIEQGLKIRPSGNYHYSGKVYGDGNYFSEVVNKSLGYTGNDNDKILLIYQVYIGTPFIYKGWFRGNSFELSYDELKSRGYDSTFVEAGNGLLNSEIIVYKEEQAHLRYIIWL